MDGYEYNAYAASGKFKLVCDRFYLNSGRIRAFARVNAYTDGECWEACAKINLLTKANLGWDDPSCELASFSSSMAGMWNSGQGNSMFFNRNNDAKADDTYGEYPGLAISAVLVQ